MTRFDFEFDQRYEPFLRLAGITPDRSHVVVDDTHVTARFGPWVVETTTDNIDCVSVGGPHKAVKAIGVRLSLADRGLTFGSSTDRTVCMTFREPVPGIDPLGLVRHPGLTVSVDDPDALADRLRSVSETEAA